MITKLLLNLKGILMASKTVFKDSFNEAESITKNVNEEKIRRLDVNNAFSSMFNPFSEDALDIFNTVSTTKQSFPPYDIIKMSESEYCIELAVAGFTEDMMTVTMKNRILSVAGKRPDVSMVPEYRYIHKGIALRSFTREFELDSGTKIESATLDNGILSIKIRYDLQSSTNVKIARK